MAQKSKEITKINSLISLFGSFDANVEMICREFNVDVKAQDSMLTISGEESEVILADKVIDLLLGLIERGDEPDAIKVETCIDLVRSGREDEITDIMNVVAVNARGKQIKCKSAGQRRYVQSIEKNSVVFGIGPAGTGKTYLAVALAVRAYKAKKIEKIILTRPAVEAGERLGFLPGDLQNKVDPYLRPLYDALQEMFGLETYAKLLERGVIEIAPLAYMRGRTLSNAFIILDEAQNTTREQMKMFLTRMGEGSRIVVTGDITQIDLPSDKASGLIHAINVLEGVPDIDVVHLTHRDVVRHKIVQNIIRAYEKSESKSKPKN